MKLTSALASVTILGLTTIYPPSLQAAPSARSQVSAPEIRIAATETTEEKISQLKAVKGKEGSAELMRKLYVKDLTPIGIQLGGAGMVVNLYSKKDNTTISLCTVYDVIVAVKKGKIAKFPPAEVK